MNIRILIAVFLAAGCSSSPPVSEDFVLISIFTACRDTSEKLKNPVDRNVYFIQASHIYNEFLKRGVPPENIFVLYKDGKPDFQEPELISPEKISKEFGGEYSNVATLQNFNLIEKKISAHLTENSRFHVIIDGHGYLTDGNFYIHSEHDNRMFGVAQLKNALQGNLGLHHLFIGSCYSGVFLNVEFGLSGLIITSCPADKSCWLDRTGYFAKYYFQNLPQSLDANNKKYIESFNRAHRQNLEFGKSRINFIMKYFGNSYEHRTLSWDAGIKIMGK